MDVLAEANRLKSLGHPVISMAVGQPSDPAPLRGSRGRGAGACRTAASATPTRSGCAGLREAIAAHYGEHYGVDVSPERIAVTTGSSAAFNLAFLAMFDVGDRVAVAAPGYPAYRNILAALGIEVVEIELDGRRPSHCRRILLAAHRRKAAEGRAVRQPGQSDRRGDPGRRSRRALIATARELGIAAISDEIYHRLAYAAPDVTALVVRRRRRRSSTRSPNTIA